MQSKYEFKATIRQTKGKAAANTLRRKGLVPAVIYGQGKEPLQVETDAAAIGQIFVKTVGKNALIGCKVDDGKGNVTDKTVMFKEVQREPVKEAILHVDFYDVDFNCEINLRIPVQHEGVPVGVKEQGGILEHGVRSLRVRCLPKAIPASIKVDISGLGLDENILLESLPKIEGVTFLDNPHTVLAHVATIEEEKAPVAAAGEAKTPEVIGEKEREAARAGKEGAAPAAKAGEAKPAAKAEAKPAAKK